MRKIKFRVWDTHTKEMITPPPISVLDPIVIGLGGQVLKVEGEDQVNDTMSSPGVYLPGQLVLMQYTGLKDRQGVEIYEGDIVTYDWGDRITTGEVKWDEAQPRFIWDSPAAGYCGGMYGNDKEEYRREVIGNIYENLELLK